MTPLETYFDEAQKVDDALMENYIKNLTRCRAVVAMRHMQLKKKHCVREIVDFVPTQNELTNLRQRMNDVDKAINDLTIVLLQNT